MNDRVERWRRVSDLFDRIVDLDPAQRAQVLATECADDPALRMEVEKLLHADVLTNPLDHDIAGHASSMLLAGDPKEHHGALFGPYRVIRLLGQGGMGRVYLAQREGDDFTQTVALKVTGGIGGGAANEAARRRFVEERRILAKLEHPHIARLLDGGVGPGAQPWFAMEYVDGAPLTEWCDARKLGIDARLELFAKICDAVDHAHRFLIVHRDLKPGNLFVDSRGDPKVLDFGIAKLLDADQQPGDASTVLLTPDYAAPEQIRGGQISTATDVYALGAVLFELLTGQRPFSDPLGPRNPPSASRVVTQNRGALTQRAVACSTTPHALRKALRGDLDRIVRTALDPDPARRYGSVAKLADDLRAVASRRPISLRSDRAYRAAIFLRRNRWSVAAASIAVVGLIATTGWALWQTQQTAQRAREAARQARIATQEARTAVSVKNLVAGLLSSAAPDVTLGRQLTVKDVLDASRQTLPKTLQQEPAVAIELLTVMARSYTALEDQPSAHALLDQAMTLAPKVDAARQAALHTARIELAMEESDVEDMQSATAALRRLLPEVRDPGLRIEALLAISDAEHHQNRGSETESIALLRLAQDSLPEGDARRIRAASLLVSVYMTPGPSNENTQKAADLLNSSLVEAQRYLPAHHPEIVNIREQLAAVYRKQREYGKAIELQRILRDDSARVHGDTSVQVAIAEAQLGSTERDRGNFDQARRHAERALQIFAANPSSDPMDRSIAKMVMAEATEARGEYAEAQRWYEASNADFMAAAPGMAKSMPFMKIHVARMMARQGNNTAAAGIFDSVLADAAPGSLAQGAVWSAQGEMERNAGDPAKALRLHQEAVRVLTPKAQGSFRSYFLMAMLQLARDQQAMKQLDASASTLATLVHELDAQFVYARPEFTDAYLMLGRQLSSRDEARDEARRLLARCVALRKHLYGPAHARTLEAEAALASLISARRV